MKFLKRSLCFLLVRNPSGVLGFLIFWIVGGGYWVVTLTGVVAPVENWVMFKVLSACSVVSFLFFSIWNFLFRTKI